MNNNRVHTYVDAIYKSSVLPEQAGNPLIEALPPYRNVDKDVISKFGRYPHICREEEMLFSLGERLQCVARLDEYIEPVVQHFDVIGSLGLLVRSGYVNRNPLDTKYTKKIKENYRRAMEGDLCEIMPIGRSTAATKAFIGISGVGKSTGVDRGLSFLPQVVRHPEHGFFQICWLKIDCPLDGSLKQFLLAFLEQVDTMLGTKYRGSLGKGNSVDELIINVAIVAETHHLGVLVIDEIQNLLIASGVGQDKMLNFFVTLSNCVKIPVVIVGTMLAMKMLRGKFRVARRAGDSGVTIWKAFSKDRSWDLFLNGLFQYQWTKNYVDMSTDLKNVLYYETQGITSLVVRLFQLSQIEAIHNGTDKLTSELIKKVAQEKFSLLYPMLNALRERKVAEIEKYEDLIVSESKKLGEDVSQAGQSAILNEAGSDPKSNESPEKTKAKIILQSMGIDSGTVKKLIDEAFGIEGLKTCIDAVSFSIKEYEHKKNIDLLESSKKQTTPHQHMRENSLDQAVINGNKNGLNAYESLKDAGFVGDFHQQQVKA